MPTAAGLYYFAHQADVLTQLPVILVHGAGGTYLHWPPEIRRLNGQRIFALDLPGHGKSGGVGRQSIDDYVQVVLGFMRDAGLRAAVFVGHSMGGAIALTMAIEHPKQVLGLGLVSSGSRLRVAPAILENTADPATFPLAVKTINDWAFGPNTNPRLKELAAQRMAETRPTVLYGDFLACDAFDVMDRLPEIHAPTLIVCGTEDKLTPVRYSKYLGEHIPAAQLELVEGAGHMVMLEQPETVSAVLETFFRKIPYRPGT